MKRFAFLLLSILLLLNQISCTVKVAETEDENSAYEVLFHTLPEVAESESFMDIALNGEGYSLLVGIPGYSSELIDLDGDFQIKNGGKRIPTPVDRTIRVYRDGTDMFSLALNPSISAKNGYAVCKNGMLTGTLDIPQVFSYDAALTAYDGVSYLLFSPEGYNPRLYVDGNLAAEAGETADGATVCVPEGIWEKDGEVLLAVGIYDTAKMPDGTNRYTGGDVNGYLLPISKIITFK